MEPDTDARHGAYICLRATAAMRPTLAEAAAEAIVHVASASAARVQAFCDELLLLMDDAARTRILGGVVQPTLYTSKSMHEFAYAHQLAQQSARGMPNAFLLPMRKTPAWWAKDWMERHTYFLPRYDDAGRMTHQGHPLAAAAGIPSLMRRTYKHPEPPAPGNAYEFINYFECADEDVATFYEVCAALRDRRKNPEWDFVRRGPDVAGAAGGTMARAVRVTASLRRNVERAVDNLDEGPLFAKDQLFGLRHREVLTRVGMCLQAGAIRFVRRQRPEGDEPPRDVVGAFVWQEVPDQMSAAFRNDARPVARVLRERLALERVDLVADETRHLHAAVSQVVNRHDFVYDRNYERPRSR